MKRLRSDDKVKTPFRTEKQAHEYALQQTTWLTRGGPQVMVMVRFLSVTDVVAFARTSAWAMATIRNTPEQDRRFCWAPSGIDEFWRDMHGVMACFGQDSKLRLSGLVMSFPVDQEATQPLWRQVLPRIDAVAVDHPRGLVITPETWTHLAKMAPSDATKAPLDQDDEPVPQSISDSKLGDHLLSPVALDLSNQDAPVHGWIRSNRLVHLRARFTQRQEMVWSLLQERVDQLETLDLRDCDLGMITLVRQSRAWLVATAKQIRFLGMSATWSGEDLDRPTSDLYVHTFPGSASWPLLSHMTLDAEGSLPTAALLWDRVLGMAPLLRHLEINALEEHGPLLRKHKDVLDRLETLSIGCARETTAREPTWYQELLQILPATPKLQTLIVRPEAAHMVLLSDACSLSEDLIPVVESAPTSLVRLELNVTCKYLSWPVKSCSYGPCHSFDWDVKDRRIRVKVHTTHVFSLYDAYKVGAASASLTALQRAKADRDGCTDCNTVGPLTMAQKVDKVASSSILYGLAPMARLRKLDHPDGIRSDELLPVPHTSPLPVKKPRESSVVTLAHLVVLADAWNLVSDSFLVPAAALLDQLGVRLCLGFAAGRVWPKASVQLRDRIHKLSRFRDQVIAAISNGKFHEEKTLCEQGNSVLSLVHTTLVKLATAFRGILDHHEPALLARVCENHLQWTKPRKRAHCANVMACRRYVAERVFRCGADEAMQRDSVLREWMACDALQLMDGSSGTFVNLGHAMGPIDIKQLQALALVVFLGQPILDLAHLLTRVVIQTGRADLVPGAVDPDTGSSLFWSSFRETLNVTEEDIDMCRGL